MLVRASWFRRALGCEVIVYTVLIAGVSLIVGTGQSVLAEESEAAASAVAPSVEPAKPAATTVLLQYKFQPGQFFHYEVADHVRYVTQQAGNAFETLQRNDSAKHYRVVTIEEDGSALLEPIIDRIRMSAKLPEKPLVEFDSAKDKLAPPEFQRHKETVGKPMARFLFTPSGELKSVKLIEANVPPAVAAAAAKADPKMSFLVPLPTEPIAVGHRWRQKYNESISAGQGLYQPVPMLRQFELIGIADGIATIKFKTSILALLNDAKAQGQLAQQTPSGTIEFDIERGLIRTRKFVTNETVLNAFGQQTLLQVSGESIEKLVPHEAVIQPAGFTTEKDSAGK